MTNENFIKCPECKRRQLEMLRNLARQYELEELIRENRLNQ